MCDTRTCAAMAHVRSFNSKLVRLKVPSRPGHPPRIDTFQFQTGSIKSTPRYSHISAEAEFQFQTGSIKSERHIIPLLMKTIVSIPNWFD